MGEYFMRGGMILLAGLPTRYIVLDRRVQLGFARALCLMSSVASFCARSLTYGAECVACDESWWGAEMWITES